MRLGRAAASSGKAVIRWTFIFISRIVLVCALITAGAVFYFHSGLPEPVHLTDGRIRGSVTLLDRNGEVFAWRGEQFGGAVTPNNVAKHLRNAVIATEDKRFYRHFGISPRGIASAIFINLREGRGPFQGHGGSTITQQVAKLLCLGVKFDPNGEISKTEFEKDCRRTTLWRKIKEVPFAVAMEIKYTKDEILTVYFNRVYLGAGAQGFEAASQRYFGKSAASVNAAEAAMLAGLLVAPSHYSPTRDLSRAQRRASVIVSLMEDQGYLSASDAAEARNRPAVLSEAAANRAGGYFADWVMESGPSFLTRSTTEDVIIRTTFDSRIQKAAEEAVDLVFETKVREGSRAQVAVVVLSPDGAVRAIVGGRNSQADGLFNRATQALRQPGSAFKPFVYAAALEAGFGPFSRVVDEPVSINVPGSGLWSPKNYTGKFLGEITLADAFAQSINSVAVKLTERVGRGRVKEIASGFGSGSSFPAGPALALGVSESTLLGLTGSYAGILNGGISVSPYGLVELRLKGDEKPLIGQVIGNRARVVSKKTAQQLVYLMHQTVERGTGTRSRLEIHPSAGKTGTTQSAKDAWFIGFTADYVAGVWMGYDDNTPLRGVTGGGLPAEIWREAMSRIHEGIPPRALPMARPGPGSGSSAVAEKSAGPETAPEDGGLLGAIRRLLGEGGDNR
ncbi:MAG: PBP1A family penicillin-binding protein [Albidovulum sp.]|nr:PBP1A family penicillin-binding protein [Albidovulum sp.]